MELVPDDILERSAVVANCRMNRERELTGPNGYDRELGFDPFNLLRERAASSGRVVSWLDLCCGSGKALIEAVRLASQDELAARLDVVGVDLVGMFLEPDPSPSRLQLVEASLSTWQPDRRFDLITCIHGLHYIGDKLGLIARAASWLTDEGRFVANLDPTNLSLATDPHAHRTIIAGLRRAGLEFDRRQRRLTCSGHRALQLPFRYLGADPQAGPNFTGQPAVTSHYEQVHRKNEAGRTPRS